jgi:hypothetical protein
VTCVRPRFSRFQLVDGVAQFGRAFVKFSRDRGFHFALHDLELGARTFGADFIEPFLQEMDLGAFPRELGKIRFLKEFDDRITPAPNLNDRFRKSPLREKNGSFGAGVHHQDVGTKLLERPGKLVALSVGIDKIEELEITLGVADDAVEIVDLKQTQIAMIILDALLLELGALFGSELAIFVARSGTGSAKLMISEERFTAVRPHPVGPAGQFHLQDAEIDPELQFLAAVQSKDLAHFDGAVLMRPILHNGIQIQAHPYPMIEHLVFNCQSSRVNAWEAPRAVATATSSVGEEDRGRRAAGTGQRSEVGGRRSEIGDQRAEGGGLMFEG